MEILCYALWAYWIVLLVRVILSWVEVLGGRGLPDALRPVAKVVYDLTEPVLGVVRRYVGPVGMFDMSVLIVFIVISIAQRIVCTV